MDFGEILDAWDGSEAERERDPGSGTDWQRLLSRYPPQPKASDRREDSLQPEDERRDRRERKRRLSRLEPQAVLDLHGLSGPEAEQALIEFLQSARRRKLEKVLVIHGKGTHSRGGPVLLGVVRACLEKSPHAGAFGPAERKHGSSGATWVILRRR